MLIPRMIRSLVRSPRALFDGRCARTVLPQSLLTVSIDGTPLGKTSNGIIAILAANEGLRTRVGVVIRGKNPTKPHCRLRKTW
jgi:hypothetical protein